MPPMLKSKDRQPSRNAGNYFLCGKVEMWGPGHRVSRAARSQCRGSFQSSTNRHVFLCVLWNFPPFYEYSVKTVPKLFFAMHKLNQ
jgi:hypothetical protein